MPSDAANSENSEGAPPSMGTFAADLPESEIQPRFTQEQLADGATLKGTANCADCTGQLLVRALPPPPEDPSMATSEGMQLVTQVVIAQAGNFSLHAWRPFTCGSVRLQAAPVQGAQQTTPIQGARSPVCKSGQYHETALGLPASRRIRTMDVGVMGTSPRSLR